MIGCKQISTATSGTVTVTDAQGDVILILTGALAVTMTIALPATPFDGQRVYISSDNGITTLTMSTPIGTIINAITTMAVGGVVAYIYDAPNTKWHKT